MKNIKFCLFSFLLSIQLLYAQDTNFKNLSIDSALLWLNKNYVDNPEGFHERALETLARAYRAKEEHQMAKSHQLLARWHGYHLPMGPDSIINNGLKSAELFERVKDSVNLAKTYGSLAIDYLNTNDLEQSEAFIFKAIAIYEALGDEKGAGASYRRLADIFQVQQEPDLSIQYGLEALKLTKRTKDYYNHSLAWLGLIKTYQDIGALDKAKDAGDNCIETVKKFVPDEVFILARGYSSRGDVLTDLKAYANALEDHEKAYAILEEKVGKDHPASKTFRNGIGNVYYAQSRFKAALPHLQAAKEGYFELGNSRVPQNHTIYATLADCYFQLGNYKAAYANQGLAHELLDTLMQDRIANLESEALIKYETGKKDQAIQDQATTIAQNNRIQWMGAGLIALLLLFLGTLFYYYNKKRKITAALSIKNKENELLLKEIHHRVKNNLQTISSLLSLQSESISDPSALDAVQESKNRVASMALIHQKLYQGENLAAVEMRDYFETIGKAVKDSFGKKAENIALEVDMSTIELDVDTAIPIGLISNELITNSLKHAFPNKEKGKISIRLSKEENGLLQLYIADDGNTSEKRGNSTKERGFGSLLIRLLAIQLGGTLEQSNINGTSTIIQFPLQEKSAA